MLDFFQALAVIPELLIGAARYPKTIGCLLLAAVVIMVGSVVVEESRRSEMASTDIEPQEEPPKERRITKVVRWLWKKE